ncbi:Hypothetical protein SMAX5B_018116 [Scophthalmus maximus]|uniref:Uncharacterized protein n=1 Tax=Scophthalmus maximus TaxID=52904 RepID=A0A2U9CI43_SCOMX|nr:Hypothetical protein SMAX5B_018116 [Scophthalmus maximus]
MNMACSAVSRPNREVQEACAPVLSVVVTTVDDKDVSCFSSSLSGNRVEEGFSTTVHQPNTARQVTVLLTTCNVGCYDWYRSSHYRSPYRPGAASGPRR